MMYGQRRAPVEFVAIRGDYQRVFRVCSHCEKNQTHAPSLTSKRIDLCTIP